MYGTTFRNIEAIHCHCLNSNPPNTVANANDLTRQIKNNPQSKLGMFTECEHLTKLSGLQLNADYTEILALISVICATGYIFQSDGHSRLQ